MWSLKRIILKEKIHIILDKKKNMLTFALLRPLSERLNISNLHPALSAARRDTGIESLSTSENQYRLINKL